MLDVRRLFLAVFASGLLTFAVIGTSAAGGVGRGTNSLTVELTKFCGPYYCPPGRYRVGTVTVTYKVAGSMRVLGVCHRETCRFSPLGMVRLYLTQKPVNRAKWHFKEWKLTNGGRTSVHRGGKLSFVIKNGTATVSAVYKLNERYAAAKAG